MQKGFTVWFTGLPSSGKTTLARMLSSATRTASRSLSSAMGGNKAVVTPPYRVIA